MAAGKFNSESDELISDINVTPFVDVVLVLLVIFIVTAPVLARNALGIKLPVSTTSDPVKSRTLGITVTRLGKVLLDGEEVDYAALENGVKSALKQDPDTQAIIAADDAAFHRDVVQAIDWLKRAGIEKFAVEVQKSGDDRLKSPSNPRKKP